MHKLAYEEIEALSNKYGFCAETWAEDYGEPGYELSEGSQGVLFGNWNHCPSHVAHALEKQFDLEWSDEWTLGTDCRKAYRTCSDSHWWQPYYVEIHGEIYGRDECEDDPEWFIEEYLLNNPDHLLYSNINIDLEKHRFILCNGEYENGWYGREDRPSEILKKAQEQWQECEFVFGDYTKGQFTVNFALYRRDKQE